MIGGGIDILALPTAVIVSESANLLFRLMTEGSEEFDNREWEKVRSALTDVCDDCEESFFTENGESEGRCGGEVGMIDVLGDCCSTSEDVVWAVWQTAARSTLCSPCLTSKDVAFETETIGV